VRRNPANRPAQVAASAGVTRAFISQLERGQTYEEPQTGEPLVIGTLYVQKRAIKRLGDPGAITVTIATS
jgi:hypothetical protein